MRKESPFPLCTVDIIIKIGKKIVLIKRKYPPKGWALPGGFVEKGESVEQAAQREAKEETGLELRNLEQFRVYSNPGRDPRFHTISVVFTADGKGKPGSATDARDLALFNPEDLPRKITFDHKKIIKDYLNR